MGAAWLWRADLSDNWAPYFKWRDCDLGRELSAGELRIEKEGDIWGG